MRLFSLHHCTSPYPPLCSSTVSSCFYNRGLKTSAPPIFRTTTNRTATVVPARDRVIDFGKHRGKMLGTLPSNYLKWVSKNLRARDFEEWAKLADLVLKDPVYRDRIEWEFAEKLLNGDHQSSRSSAVSELLEMSERFGWDNEDKAGWSKIDFELIGTSKGGRIPRVISGINVRVVEREDVGDLKRSEKDKGCRVGERVRGGERSSRQERRERMRLKRSSSTSSASSLPLQPLKGMMMMMGRDEIEEEEDDEITTTTPRIQRNREINQDGSPPAEMPTLTRFPGRQSLLKKVLNDRSLY